MSNAGIATDLHFVQYARRYASLLDVARLEGLFDVRFDSLRRSAVLNERTESGMWIQSQLAAHQPCIVRSDAVHAAQCQHERLAVVQRHIEYLERATTASTDWGERGSGDRWEGGGWRWRCGEQRRSAGVVEEGGTVSRRDAD